MCAERPEPPADPADGVWTHGENEYDYELVYELDKNGRVAPLEFRVRGIGGAPITAAAIRAFPFGTKATEHRPSREAVISGIVDRQDHGWAAFDEGWETVPRDRPPYIAAQQLREALSASTETPPRRGGRPRLTDEKLQEVAEVYRDAWLQGSSSPVQAVNEHFDRRDDMRWAYSTVRKWVQAARQRGFLSPAIQERRPGVKPPEG